ncbi:MAG: M20 family metallopeptidase, partial [Oceanibaculum nanhaiense]|nr:M20 family metallopeptidase [Oceanibaculum nanhaiense]
MNDIASNQPRIDAEEILHGIRRWVEVESPSHDAAAVNRMADLVEADMRAIGATIERTPGREGWGDILTARTPWGGDGPGILVLSHIDTVHPMGFIKDVLPFKQEDDKVFGPGIYDMKGGAYLAYYAYRHLVRSGKQTPLPITFMFVPEEEVGSPTSQKIIEQMALKNKYVLVTEPARDGGKIVTSRKGVLHFDVKCEGRPAHAGAQHQDGRSAIREMAKQIIRFEELTNYETGVTCNVGLVSGGSGVNVVPQFCTAEVDMRVPTPELAEEMTKKILGFTAFDADVKVTITGGINRPPYVKDAGITKLFDHAKALAAEIGFELEDVKITGGGSDGNFTAAVGVPTLDGLGVDGRGAYTDYEQAYYSSFEPRA